MQFRVGKPFAQARPFRLRFLHPVFTERALPLFEQRLDLPGGASLADRDQSHLVGLAAGDLAAMGDRFANMGERG